MRYSYKLTYYLENEKERQKLVDKGYEYAVEYTQEKYAEKFLKGEKIKGFIDQDGFFINEKFSDKENIKKLNDDYNNYIINTDDISDKNFVQKRYENLNEIVKDDVIFSCSGVTNGELVKGVKFNKNKYQVETLLMHNGSKKITKLSKEYDLDFVNFDLKNCHF